MIGYPPQHRDFAFVSWKDVSETGCIHYVLDLDVLEGLLAVQLLSPIEDLPVNQFQLQIELPHRFYHIVELVETDIALRVTDVEVPFFIGFSAMKSRQSQYLLAYDFKGIDSPHHSKVGVSAVRQHLGFAIQFEVVEVASGTELP